MCSLQKPSTTAPWCSTLAYTINPWKHLRRRATLWWNRIPRWFEIHAATAVESKHCQFNSSCNILSRYPLVTKHGNWKSPINGALRGRPTKNWWFSIAMFDYWRACHLQPVFTRTIHHFQPVSCTLCSGPQTSVSIWFLRAKLSCLCVASALNNAVYTYMSVKGYVSTCDPLPPLRVGGGWW
jgi:hypothetical protein